MLTKMATDWKKAIHLPPCTDYSKLRLLQWPLAGQSNFLFLATDLFFLIFWEYSWAAVKTVAAYPKPILIMWVKNESKDTNCENNEKLDLLLYKMLKNVKIKK